MLTTTAGAPASTTVRDVTPRALPTSRRWALLGLGAGIAGIVSVVASGTTGAVYEKDVQGDAVAITDRLSGLVPQILTFHVATMASALLLTVFAVGLQRDLARRLPADSLWPGIAANGLLLVAVAQLLGSGLTTEFVFSTSDPGTVVPEAAAFFGHWIGTIPWLWGTAGLAALAVAAGAFRHAAYPRWMGVVSVVLGGLALLFAVSPLQYMAGLVGPLWVVAISAGLLLSRRTPA
jgi:hypothetical protein